MNRRESGASRPRLGCRWPWLVGVVLGFFLSASAVAHPHENEPDEQPPWTSSVLDLKTLSNLDQLVKDLRDTRVVLVGESHDRYEHHLNQLAIIRGLYEQDPRLAIGLEFFQQPFQEYLDRYVAGDLDERTMLKRTEYYSRWRFDYRLYRPILQFAREHGIPLVALNIPGEVTSTVAKQGLEALTPEQRKWVPEEIDRNNPAYETRMRVFFRQHPMMAEGGFERFFDAQLLWDESMAERAARYLKDNPDRRMVVLAGSGHLEYGDGIPSRLKRRLEARQAVVLNGLRGELEPGLADYLLLPERRELPPSGLLGIMLETGTNGPVVEGFSPGSPARKAGMSKRDRILRINGEKISDYTDIRLALLGYAPGEKVKVDVERKRLFFGRSELSFEVELQ